MRSLIEREKKTFYIAERHPKLIYRKLTFFCEEFARGGEQQFDAAVVESFKF